MRVSISGSFAAVLAVLLVIVLSRGIGFGAQGPPSSSVGESQQSIVLELRINELEVRQEMTEKALNQSNEEHRGLLTGIGAIIAIMVMLQGYISVTQMRREQSRYEDYSERERAKDEANRTQIHREQDRYEEYFDRQRRRDAVDRGSIEKLAPILDVLKNTLESRLTIEEQEHRRANKAEEELRDVLEKVDKLTKFVDRFEDRNRQERTSIEKSARELASLSRHEFRGKAKELNHLVDRFNSYQATPGGMSDTEDVRWISHVPFVRGIAAHFSNQPKLAESCFKEVVDALTREAGENEIEFNRRQATAYYYLGMTQSNFGFVRIAYDYFEKANKKDLGGRDYLSRIVFADACTMSGEYEKASEYINQVLDSLRIEEQREGRLRNSELRNRSRAKLIQATTLISLREEDWRPKAIRLLREVHDEDPNYYYATSTLAQLGPENERTLFKEAYDAIEVSAHLNTVTEVRTRILLLMIAGMCCRHGLMDMKRSDLYLDQADEERSDLPVLDSTVCTVFSTLSFRDVNSETIAQHIREIRAGTMLLEPGHSGTT